MMHRARIGAVVARPLTGHELHCFIEVAPAGIISMGDLVAARIGAAELEASVLRDIAHSRLLAG